MTGSPLGQDLGAAEADQEAAVAPLWEETEWTSPEPERELDDG